MENNGILVVFIILFVFCLWVYTGGPSHPISFAGPYLTPITNVDQTSEGYGSGVEMRDSFFSSYGTGSGSSYDDGDARQRIADIQDEIAELELYGVSSPFRGRVAIQGVSTSQNGKSTRGEYVTIYSNSGEPINITGWQLVSGVTRSKATIPQGESLPRSTRGGAVGNIMLAGGSTATITTGRSPRSTSFRENACTGYFEEREDYTPSLESFSCPSPREELGDGYAGSAEDYNRCRDYVDSLPSCKEPSGSTRNVPSSCVRFLEQRLSYSGCVRAHEQDADFLGDSWRIFLGKDDVLWRSSNDTVKLLDAQGRTVDVYRY